MGPIVGRITLITALSNKITLHKYHSTQHNKLHTNKENTMKMHLTHTKGTYHFQTKDKQYLEGFHAHCS
jgi:hypothetical protein